MNEPAVISAYAFDEDKIYSYEVEDFPLECLYSMGPSKINASVLYLSEDNAR